MTVTNPYLDAARSYISLGLRVIALTGKTPNTAVHAHWKEDCFPRSSGLREAFMHPETTGVGILTSYPYVVIDIDGDEGAEQWYDIVGRQVEDMYPDRWVASTGRGLHLWYADHEPRGTVKLGAKLDMKGEGGYVAAPPSLHPSGRVYQWLLPPELFQPPSEIPDGLRTLLDKRAREQERLLATKQMNRRIRHEQFDDGKWWPTWGFEGVFSKLRDAEEGNRNATLYWAAHTLAEDGATDEDWEGLLTAAAAAGLTNRETRLTIRSARKANASE